MSKAEHSVVKRKTQGSKPIKIVRRCFGIMSPTGTLHIDKLAPTRGECWGALYDDEGSWLTIPKLTETYSIEPWEDRMQQIGWRCVRVYLGVRT